MFTVKQHTNIFLVIVNKMYSSTTMFPKIREQKIREEKMMSRT